MSEKKKKNSKSVDIQNISHFYNDTVHAVDKINLSLKKGEFFTTIGPSGCGKTTLMDIVAGL